MLVETFTAKFSVEALDKRILQRLRGADTTAVTFAYDAQHRLIRRTDARNQVTQYTYDASGRFAQATLPDGATRDHQEGSGLAIIHVSCLRLAHGPSVAHRVSRCRLSCDQPWLCQAGRGRGR